MCSDPPSKQKTAICNKSKIYHIQKRHLGQSKDHSYMGVISDHFSLGTGESYEISSFDFSHVQSNVDGTIIKSILSGHHLHP